jgi:hypothetical protein
VPNAGLAVVALKASAPGRRFDNIEHEQSNFNSPEVPASFIFQAKEK